MITLPLKFHEATALRIGRLFVVAVGAGCLAVAFYRMPAWLEIWSVGTVAMVITAAGSLLVIALLVALRGSARAVERVALEVVLLGGALVAANTILLLRASDTWSDNPLAQHFIARERAAERQHLPFDRRNRLDVVRDLRAHGLDAVLGIAQSAGTSGAVAAAVRERGILPLSNASNTYVVECNEGAGFFQFRSDEYGFNNRPGLASGPIDIAVIGESLALGHCVPPSRSAVDKLRARHPRTANFGVAGSRVLSQLGVLREYVQPLQPPITLWFLNTNFAEPRDEGRQPLLLKYLDDPSFSQHLRERSNEVDSFVREVLLPLTRQSDESLRSELEAPRRPPIDRLLKLEDVRNLVDFGPSSRRSLPPPDLGHFERALDAALEAVHEWNGRLIVVVLPNFEISTQRAQNVARYRGVLAAVERSGAEVVDGVEVFAAQPDFRDLYTLRISNHPSERGHALLAEAILSAIDDKEVP